MKKTGKIISLLCLACAAVLMTLGITFLLPENLIQGSKAAGNQHITYSGTDGQTIVDNGVNKTLVGSANTLNTLVRNNANNANAYFVLINDIDLSGFANWSTILTLNATAVFDGNNYSIKNLKITSGSTTGLFGTVNGTVKNLVMENISINTSGSYVGVIAGKSSGAASKFENITVSSGTFTGTGNAYGAIIGEVSGGKTTVEGCLNAVNIRAAYFIGGIIGHSNGSAIIIVSKCANEGNIEATSSSYGYTGGIFGLSEGSSNVTIEWSYNKGTIKTIARDSGGILGSAWSGSATIRNCFNDAALNLQSWQGAITTKSTAILTITNCWFNLNKYTGNVCSQGGNSGTGANIVFPNTGSQTTVQMSQQAFVDLMNAGANPPVFVLSGGQVCLAVFNKTVKLTFMVDGTEYFVLNQEIDGGDGAIILPENGTVGYQSPEKIGYDFLGWENLADNQMYDEGDEFLNPLFNEITFEAVLEKITYKIRCIDETGRDVEYIGVEEIKIGETDNLGTDEWLDNDYNWLVKFGDANGENLQDWVNLGSNQNLPLSLTADFIIKYANADHEIFFKIIRTASASKVNVRSTIIPEGLGSFKYSIRDDEGKISEGITANIGGVITLPVEGQLLKLEATSSSKYYEFANFILYDELGAPVGDEIADAIFDCSNDPRFDLENIINNYTIEVNFRKAEFLFDISEELRDGDIGEDNFVTLNPGTENAAALIGESFDIGAVAAAENSQGNYKFFAWKMYDMYEGAFVYVSYDLEFALSMASGGVTADWLDQYLYNDKITIVAEYVEMYNVSISMESGQDSFGIMIIDYHDPLTGESGPSSFIHNMQFSAGSYISILVYANEKYEFAGFVGAGINQFDTFIEFTVTGAVNITAVFRHQEYNVLVESKDTTGGTVRNADFTNAIIGTVNASGIKTLADALSIAQAEILANNVTGYIFTGFTIKSADGDVVEISSDEITDELLDANLNDAAVPSFIITANFVKIYKLSAVVSEGSLEIGDIDVYIVVGGQETLTTKREFAYGTKLKIKAKVKEGAAEYFEFDEFFGKRDGEGDGSELSFIIDLNRNITAYFKAKPFTLTGDLKTKGNGKIDIAGETNLAVGDSVVLMANPGSGKVVKSWTVNGVKIKDLEKNSKYQVSVSGNSVTIGLTSEWLSDYGTELNSLVQFKMSDAIMLAILIPSIIVPLLLIVFAIYFINYRRKMAIVKKHLQEENRTKVTRGVASFIEDIREGKNVGQVTKEDVKQAMKKKKDDK